jgi:hypothetical protein
MEEECARYRCEGEDGSPITVLEFQYFGQAETKPGRRRYPGAQRLDVAARNDDRPELQYRAVFGSHCVRRIDAGNARSVRQKPHSVRPTRNADPLAYGRQKAVVSARAAFRAGMVEYRRPPSEGHNRSVLTLETAAALARTEL